MRKFDWCDLPSVIAYAKRLGPGMTVFKHVTRSNYNITHTLRRDLWDKPSVRVVFNT
jgi:hypothetical protein